MRLPFPRRINITGELRFYFDNYRWGGVYAEMVFSPLEQIDRTVKPDAWPDPGIDGMHRSWGKWVSNDSGLP